MKRSFISTPFPDRVWEQDVMDLFMTIKIILLQSLSLGLQIFAQGAYPLQIGNVWQYHDSYDSTYGWTHKTIKDTIMSNGLTYIMLMADNVGGYFDGYYRQDGSKVFYYGRYPTSDTTYQDYEELWYDFSKTTGDTVRVTVQANPPDTITVRVIDDRIMNVFGKMRRTWVFYETSKRTSVDILRQVADSIGLIYVGGEGGIAFSLFGAIINGTKYGTITKVKDPHQFAPNTYLVYQNYPNPFNPTTTISYQLPAKNVVTLRVYDLLGREIAVLVNEQQDAGTYSTQWNGSQFSSGIYIAVMRAGSFTAAKKLMLMK